MSPSQISLPLDECRDITLRTSREPSARARSATPSSGPDRLFVPLAAEPFRWFHSGKKVWELRKLGRQFTPAHVRLGREVELRRGYSDSGSAIWGEIVDVLEAASLTEFFQIVSWRTVLPESESLDEAIEQASRILNIEDIEDTPVLGFRIELAGS